jgi:hypothetical protein
MVAPPSRSEPNAKRTTNHATTRDKLVKSTPDPRPSATEPGVAPRVDRRGPADLRPVAPPSLATTCGAPPEPFMLPSDSDPPRIQIRRRFDDVLVHHDGAIARHPVAQFLPSSADLWTNLGTLRGVRLAQTTRPAATSTTRPITNCTRSIAGPYPYHNGPATQGLLTSTKGRSTRRTWSSRSLLQQARSIFTAQGHEGTNRSDNVEAQSFAGSR